jgi:hypothetical protein
MNARWVPTAGSDAYMNCEVNCGGTMLIGVHGGLLGEGAKMEADDRCVIRRSIAAT